MPEQIIAARDVREGDTIRIIKAYPQDTKATWEGVVAAIIHGRRLTDERPLEFRLRGMDMLAPARDVCVELLHRDELSFPNGTLIRAQVRGRGVIPLFKVERSGPWEWVTTSTEGTGSRSRFINADRINPSTVDVVYRPDKADC